MTTPSSSGARSHDAGFADAGAAYVYVRNAGTWTQQQKFTASDPTVNKQLGNAVAVHGDAAAIAALNDNVAAGAVYVFVRSTGSWAQQQKLTASDGGEEQRFGSSVAVHNDTVVSGAIFANGAKGAAYVFERTGTNWAQQQILTA